jgi:hypothetical protein
VDGKEHGHRVIDGSWKMEEGIRKGKISLAELRMD